MKKDDDGKKPVDAKRNQRKNTMSKRKEYTTDEKIAELGRRINKQARRIDKMWADQNAINEKATEALSTIMDLYAKYGHSTSEKLQ